MSRITIEAPAKINLRLIVLAREISGFHSLETLFCAISIADVLEIEPDSTYSLEVQGDIDTGPAADNLVTRAVQAFHRVLGRSPGVRIRLQKRIPAAAGLGGGSSDAAATLRGLNALHDDALDESTLRRIGTTLGSDVSFFLGSTPFALAWGRGERLLELAPPRERHVLIGHPGGRMPTPEIFGRLADQRGDNPILPRPLNLDPFRLGDWPYVAELAENDLEPIALERVPRIGAGLNALRDAGAQIALLSGSGASIFGIFEDPARVAPAAERLVALGFRTWPARTLRTWPRPVRAGAEPPVIDRKSRFW